MRCRCRLLTYNIAHGRGLSLYQGFVSPQRLRRNVKAIGSFVRDAEIDVLALQEVDFDSHWTRRINLLGVIQSVTKHPFGAMGINNRRDGDKVLAYGNGVLSRFPIAHWENMPFGSAKLGEKGFLYTELKLPVGVVPLIVLHLDFRSAERRIKQLSKLVTYVQNLPAAPNRFTPIFCGDFNSGPRSGEDAVRQLHDALRVIDDYRIYPVGMPTFPSIWPKQKIDFIFTPAAFRVNSCDVPRVFFSDHRPVLIEFEVSDSTR